MPSPPPQRPPPLIDLLAACLAAGIERRRLDRTMASALTGPAMDYQRLAELAGRHLVTPMLGDCLDAAGLRQDLPEDFVRYLDLLHEQNRRRNAGLVRQLAEIAAELNAVGIEPVLIKGAIRLVDGLYPSIGWRFMRDLDVLIAPERLSDAAERLQTLGYRFPEGHWPEAHRHLAPLRRQGDGAVIELHTDLLARSWSLCPANDVRARATPADLEGAVVRIPAGADQLAHLIGHDLTDGFLRRSAMLRLRSLFEAALLCRDRTARAQLLARAEGRAVRARVRVVLGLAASFFPDQVGPLPAGGPGTRARVSGLRTVERLDEDGRWRRLMWFARMRLSKLARRRDEQRHVGRSLLRPGYYQRCSRRLRRLWISD